MINKTASTSRRDLLSGLAALGVAGVAGAHRAQAAMSDEQALVDRARITIDSMGHEAAYGTMRAYMAKAVGVLIVPQLLKAGFIIGGSGGSGVLVGHTRNGWTDPAFYALAAGSIGFQIGVQEAEVVLVINHERGLEAILQNQMKLGVDASVAVGPVGTGIEAATTTNLNADIYSFSRTKGIFAGISLEGTGILVSNSSNKAYYGRPVNPRDILINQTVTNSGADRLRQTLAALTT